MPLSLVVGGFKFYPPPAFGFYSVTLVTIEQIIEIYAQQPGTIV